MAKDSALDKVSVILVIIGALNWGLALFDWDVAQWSAAGWWATLVKIVYALVALSGIWMIYKTTTD